MKKVILLVAMSGIMGMANAQRLRETIDASKYQAYDTTTFFFTLPQGTGAFYVDYTDFSANNAVMYVELCGDDEEGTGKLTLYNNAGTAVDSVILNDTGNIKTIRKKDGTRSTVSRSWFRFQDGFGTKNMALTIKWNSVATGTFKVYY